MKVSIVAGYQSQVAMTFEFLDNLRAVCASEREREMILVNAGCPTKLEHPYITKRIDLPENISFSHTMNTGIRASKGDFVIVMNNDCFPTHGWIDKLVRYQQQTGAFITSPEVSSPSLSCVGHCITDNENGDYAVVNFYPAVCWMLTRECIDKVGLFDEQFVPTFFEDNDYARRVQDAGGKFIVVRKVAALHRRSVENSANLNMSEAYAANESRYKRKWNA